MKKEINPPTGIYSEHFCRSVYATYINIQDWRPVPSDLGNPMLFPYGHEVQMLLIPAYIANIEQVGSELARNIDLTEEESYVFGQSFGLRVRYRFVQELRNLASVNSPQRDFLNQMEKDYKACETSFADYLSQFTRALFKVDPQLDDELSLNIWLRNAVQFGHSVADTLYGEHLNTEALDFTIANFRFKITEMRQKSALISFYTEGAGRQISVKEINTTKV